MLLLFLLTQENFGLVETLKTTVSAAQEARGMMNLPGDEDDVRTLNTLNTLTHTQNRPIAPLASFELDFAFETQPWRDLATSSFCIVLHCAVLWCCGVVLCHTHRNRTQLQQGEDGPLLGIPRGGAAAQSMDRGGGGGGGGGAAKPPQTKPTTF